MNITHNTTTQRFETTIDGTTAYLSYQVLNDGVLDYNHTIVPSQLSGRGIGSALAEFALQFAQDTHKKVVPSCSFVAHYIDKHPKYQNVLQ